VCLIDQVVCKAPVRPKGTKQKKSKVKPKPVGVFKIKPKLTSKDKSAISKNKQHLKELEEQPDEG